jgi:hypothetical protein
MHCLSKIRANSEQCSIGVFIESALSAKGERGVTHSYEDTCNNIRLFPDYGAHESQPTQYKKSMFLVRSTLTGGRILRNRGLNGYIESHQSAKSQKMFTPPMHLIPPLMCA